MVADPALLLGAAVVKSACKIWLKDNAIAADAATDVLDIIQSKVADVREQRRVRRLFEDLEERVADNVVSSLGAEFRNVPDNDRDAAVLAVRDTFDRAGPTAGVVFAADLDAVRLERLVRPFGRKLTDTLSADATALYDRVLFDCCAYVVEVANVLPGFQTGVFREILSRQHEIMRHLDERFDLLPMQLGGRGAETFEPTYLRLAAKQLDKVELFGVTVSDRVGNYPLSVAYVSLSLRAARESRHEPAMLGRRVTSIGDGLGSVTRAFIRGEAGSGKTTLLQWLAVRAARREFDGPMADWNGCVPLFIRLRRYSGKELPAPEHFLSEVGRNIADTMPLGWVHRLLATGRALVLVDGVDELPEAQRRQARTWLRDLVDTYSDARYVVTSRPAAAEESWLDGESFDALEIQPMTVSDIDAFVTHWHAAMAEGGTETDRVESSRATLVEAIRTRRHLRMLAVSPLMTALICALHLDRRMQLPDDRMELYAIALDMLLERRDTEREIQASDRTIVRADKMLILEDLAYWLVRNGWSDASRERVEERLSVKLAALHRVQGSAKDVLTHLLDRSGLLRAPVEGRIDFVHKTFQEFLAARAAVANDDIGVLVQHAHDDQWREVVLMAAGQARPRQTEELLRQLLDRAERATDDERYVLRVLAVGALQHTPQLPSDLREQVNDIAGQLLPPGNFAEAAAVAVAGELVLELLPLQPRPRGLQVAATIHMASVIGGEHAMATIAGCVRDPATSSPDSRVSSALMSAWTRFDPEEFAERVLAGTAYADYLRAVEPSVLAGLKHLRPRYLICDFWQGHGNVDYLDDIPGLDGLEAADLMLRDLSAVARHPALARLSLGQGTPAVNIAPIGRCGTLRSLALPHTAVEDMRQLSEIGQVRSLEFTSPTAPADVMPWLASELRLEQFRLARSVGALDLAELLAAPQLQSLEFLLFRDRSSLKSIEGIGRWEDTMTGISLQASRLRDVSALAGLSRLTYLDLTGTPVSSLDFVRELTSLNELHLGGGAPIPALEPLCDLPSLRSLHFPTDAPLDLSGLAGAADLEVHVVSSQSALVRGRDKLSSSVSIVFDP